VFKRTFLMNCYNSCHSNTLNLHKYLVYLIQMINFLSWARTIQGLAGNIPLLYVERNYPIDFIFTVRNAPNRNLILRVDYYSEDFTLLAGHIIHGPPRAATIFCLLFQEGIMRMPGFFMVKIMPWIVGLKFHCHPTNIRHLDFINLLSSTVSIPVYPMIWKSVNSLLWRLRFLIRKYHTVNVFNLMIWFNFFFIPPIHLDKFFPKKMTPPVQGMRYDLGLEPDLPVQQVSSNLLTGIKKQMGKIF
jgi:hypothetical protein